MTLHRFSTPGSSAAVLLAVLLSATSSAAQPRPARPKPAPVAPSPPPPAPPPEPPSLADTLTGEAKADYEAAKLLYTDGDNSGALVKFASAYDKSKDPRLLWNVAACEKNLRHYANVLAYVRQYLKEGDAVLSAADKTEAQSLLTSIEPFTAALDVKVNEPDAEIYIDGALAGKTPLAKPITVDLGMRSIRIVKEGFVELKKELPVGGSPSIQLDLMLEKIVHEGTLVVNARPGNQIFIDGTSVGLGTWRGTVTSGGHMLRVSAPEMRTYQSDVLVRDKETRTIAITLEREIKPSAGVPTWAWIGGSALAIAGASVGGYFLFKPDDKQPITPVGTLDPGSVQAGFPGVRFR